MAKVDGYAARWGSKHYVVVLIHIIYRVGCML